MNKIILLVIALIIGCVFSTGMEAPKPEISNTDFTCSMKAIKACGNSDNKCLKDFMKNCEKNPSLYEKVENVSHTTTTTTTTHQSIVVTTDHKNHHTYKTSIIVKDATYDDESDYKRICITDTNCNCKTIAKTNCEKSEDSNCYNQNLNDCKTRCRKSRRCYRMDCHNAGKSRCEQNAAIECAILHPDSSVDRFACVEKESSCCKRFEKATCLRAKRVYKFRTECAAESQKKCVGYNVEEQKCHCITQTRHTCLVNKVETYRQSVRQVFDCEDASSIICSEKKCGSNYDLCVKKEKSICEPVCQKESRLQCNNQVNGECYQTTYKKCIHHWKRTFCEKRAQLKCGEDSECLSGEKELCKRDIPTCMTGEVSCDDKNKCTEDICHPTKGCINKPINCDDKNACTTESCDPALGCVYRTKKCDDGKLCTKDSCNPVSGLCKFTYDSNISHDCGNGYCDKDLDCAAWEKAAHLADKCQKAVCNTQYGSCQAVSVKKCAQRCKLSCQPYHACDTATCVLNKKINDYECVHTTKDCNDHKSCTIDSCDQKLGCSHKLDTTVCPPNPICDNDSDCKQWETSQNLRNQCQQAYCDIHRGICIAESSTQDCSVPDCQRTCKGRNACETATCVINGQRARCSRQPLICDDKKDCTVDTCDNKLGCLFQYKVSQVCKTGGQCTHTVDCKNYEVKERLAEQCLKAVCDPKLGTCVKTPIDAECERKRNKCKIDCTPKHHCESARCYRGESGEFACERTTRTCDDGKSCTIDTCHNNLGCVYTYKPDTLNCPPDAQCKNDGECVRWGFTQKLGKQCKRAVCDQTTGACKVVPKVKRCIPPTECNLNCKAQNVCETASCDLNDEGDYVCKRVSKTCNDNDDCTLDSCDLQSGKCTFTPIDSGKCKKCTSTSDCDNWSKLVADDCLTSVCDSTTSRCKLVPTQDQTCEDKKRCRKSCVGRNQCETATCVYDATLKKHTCQYSAKTDDKACAAANDCTLNCKPANLCETTSCAKQTDGTYACIRSVNTCNDNKSCTKDSCDLTTGKCVNTYTPSDKCEPNAYCDKNLDCAQWAAGKELDNCLTPVCDSETGSCKAVPNQTKCSSKTCKKQCPPRDACEDSYCSYDANLKKLVCQYERKSCDDKNKCTRDSCDVVKGCQNTFDSTIDGCNTPRCETVKDCVKFAQDGKLADDCKEAICDSETKTCRAVLINNSKCNPYLNKCKRECSPRTACETADCIIDANTKKYKCLRSPITCDDKNDCTVDVCDPVQGCKFTYTVSPKCEQYCNDNNDCAQYGLNKKASLRCKVPYCDKTTSSCRLQKDTTNTNCKPIDIKCELVCKPKDACNTAVCTRKGDNELACTQVPITCNDNKDCTEDSCDPKQGCVFKFKESSTCKKECKVDIDCDNWAVTEKLADKCMKARCSKKLGSCVPVKGPQTDKCKTTDQCNVTSDCPQGKFGTVCCVDSGLKKCCDNQCETDSDCVPKDKKKEWGYCRVRDSGKKECDFMPKCKGNEDCDDKNPCTKDVCLPEYGFCKNLPRCVDNTLCTHDICVPSEDKKTYTCKNPTKSCTNDKTLLDKNYDSLTTDKKTKWIGKCSHLEGCVTCVVNAQCDDNNGCTTDSCVNQFCVSTPIDNKWCDPKLSGQAITVQGYFPKFTRL